MNSEEKRKYVMERCSVERDGIGLYVDTEDIVGNFCGRSFYGSDDNECYGRIIDYFNSEKEYPHTMVGSILRQIGW